MRSTSNEDGFTLIEVMIVLLLVGAMGTFALPKLGAIFKTSINTASRELASVAKESYNSALLTGRVHRIVYDLQKRQYWAESGPSTVLLDTQETREREERRKRFARPDDKPPPSKFSLAKAVTRKKVALPRGVEFEDLVTEQKLEPITEGMAYTHFFPHGIAERTIIHLQDASKNQSTLIISSLMGRTKVIPRHVKAEDPDAK